MSQMRIFAEGQRVIATCDIMREEKTQSATVLIVSPNRAALVIEFDGPVGLLIGGGIAVTPTVPLSQDADGSIADLWGNAWQLEDET